MKFVFTDKKVTLPNSIHAYAEKKVGKLDRFFKEDATATITFSVEKERLNRVEVTIRSFSTLKVMVAVASSLKKRSSFPTFFSA